MNQQFPFKTSVDIADCSCLQTEIFLYIFITISVLCVQMPMIKLQSLEGEVFEIDVEIARQSVTIKTMLEGNQKLFYSVYRPIVFIEKWKYIKSFCTHKNELHHLAVKRVWMNYFYFPKGMCEIKDLDKFLLARWFYELTTK